MNKQLKEELKMLKDHFKKHGWDLSYYFILEDLEQCGVHTVDCAKFLVDNGYRVVYSPKMGELVIRK